MINYEQIFTYIFHDIRKHYFSLSIVKVNLLEILYLKSLGAFEEGAGKETSLRHKLPIRLHFSDEINVSQRNNISIQLRPRRRIINFPFCVIFGHILENSDYFLSSELHVIRTPCQHKT